MNKIKLGIVLGLTLIAGAVYAQSPSRILTVAPQVVTGQPIQNPVQTADPIKGNPVPVGKWSAPSYTANGYCETYHGTRVYWAIGAHSASCSDSGGVTLPPHGFANTTGNFGILYSWTGYNTKPTMKWYTLVVNEVGIASGTNADTGMSGTHNETLYAYPYQSGGIWFLNYTTNNVNGYSEQKNSLQSWKCQSAVSISPGTPT